VAGHVLARRPALEKPRGAGEEPELVHARRQFLGGGQAAGLAGVAYLGVDQLVRVGLDRVGDLQQRALPLGRGGVPPALKGSRGRIHGGVHVASARDRGASEHVAGTRVDEIAVATVGGVDEGSVDEVAQRLLLGHEVTPTWR
jgi:hypothetical protein